MLKRNWIPWNHAYLLASLTLLIGAPVYADGPVPETLADVEALLSGRTPHLLYTPVILNGVCLLRYNWTFAKGKGSGNEPPNVFAATSCPVNKDGTCTDAPKCGHITFESENYSLSEVFVSGPNKDRNEGFDKYGRQVKQHVARDEEANRVAVVSLPLAGVNFNMCVWPFWPVAKNRKYKPENDKLKLNMVGCKPSGYDLDGVAICPGLVECIDKEIPGAKPGVVVSRTQPLYPYPDLSNPGNPHATGKSIIQTAGHTNR